MKPRDIDHVLITRFNVPTPGRESVIRSRDGWLRNRVELFEKYCLPSVEAQTNANFRWIVYCDPASPPWFMEWLAQERFAGHFTPVFRAGIGRDELVADLRNITGARAGRLLTTNLDNDDGLSPDFVARLQRACMSGPRTAIYLSTGIVLKGTQAFMHTDRANAFCTVSESWDDPVTAWADWHTRLGLTMDVAVVDGGPAWLQVIHDQNVSNTVRGHLVQPCAYAAAFPYALTGLPNVAPRALQFDRLVRGPGRRARTAARSAVKTVLIRALGPRGFDGLKNRLTFRGGPSAHQPALPHSCDPRTGEHNATG